MHEKKYVFITGISSGFGFEITKALLKKNYQVVGAIRGGEKRGFDIYSEYATYIQNKSLQFIDVELNKKDSVDVCMEKVLNLLPEGLDILINNAGYGLLGPIELQSENDIRDQFETNFFAPLFIIQKLLPLLRKRKGKILNFSSLVGFTVFPYYGTYSASKHALDCLSEALYYDVNEFGIQVCAIEPGGYKTKFSPNAMISKENHPEAKNYSERIEKFNKFLVFVQKKVEKDPVEVVKKVICLCESKKIPVRIQIGSESHLNWLIKKITPDQLRIKIQDWIYKTFLF